MAVGGSWEMWRAKRAGLGLLALGMAACSTAGGVRARRAAARS